MANQSRRTFQLSQIVDRDQVVPLDDENNRFSIVRLPCEKIEFVFNRPHLIFDPDDAFSFGLRINPNSNNALPAECQVEIARARSSGRPIHSEAVPFKRQQNGRSVLDHTIRVPTEEGVYNLRFQVNSSRGNGLYRRRNFDREVQFVVLDPNKTIRPNRYQKLVQEIGPNALRSSLTQQQFGQFSRLIGLKTNQAVGRFNIANDVNAVQLPVGGWQAVPINIKNTNRPHVIEVDYSTADPMSLGFSILQPDETGQIPNFGFDSGLYVPDSIVKPAAGSAKRTHRFCFWPNSRQVYLLMANRHQANEANYLGIRVLEGEQANSVQQRIANKRSVMTFLEQPLVVENFAIDNIVDPALGQPIHDWVSFYKGVNRLAQYLVDSGYSGAFMNVLGEGSALVPLSQTHPSPRYDSGAFSAAGHDPVRKDVVEMIYRIFERNGLKFVPVLTFDSRHSAIEFDEQNNPNPVLTDFRGEVVRKDNYPIYDPLNPKVRETVSATVQEIARRYSNRDSYRGVAIICRPDTYTMLPGSRTGGYGLSTIERFDPDATADVASVLSSERYDDWVRWRMGEMSRWYEQLRDVICSGSEQAKLHLAIVDPFGNDELHSFLSPSLHRPVNVAEALKRIGLDLDALNKDDSIVVMQPESLSPVHSLSSQKSDIAARSSQQWEQWTAKNAYAANLFLHRSSWARFENLEASAIFSRQTSPIVRLQHLNPAGVWNQERFARALLESDVRQLVRWWIAFEHKFGRLSCWNSIRRFRRFLIWRLMKFRMLSLPKIGTRLLFVSSIQRAVRHSSIA